MDTPEKLFECFLLCGLFVLIPVHIGKTPEEGLIAEIFCHLKVGLAVLSLGRPVVFFHGFPGKLSIECFKTCELFCEAFRITDPRHIRMVVCMVCDDMPLGDHTLYEVRTGLKVVADNKKCGGNVMLFQGIKDRRSVTVLVSGIEGEIKNLFAGKIGIPGMILF